MVELLLWLNNKYLNRECRGPSREIRLQVIDGEDGSRFKINARQATLLRRGHRHLKGTILHSDADLIPARALAFDTVVTSFGSNASTTIQVPQHLDGHYVLFFDGGSRGNPDPGGSGSVIIRLGDNGNSQTLVWTACMAYGRITTTTNFAEYQGLLHGLRYALAHNLRPLHVVGDSAMIIRQHLLWRAPKKGSLLALYRGTARLVMQLTVLSWTHHYRQHSKMADTAANIAMDSKNSSQHAANGGKHGSKILEHMYNDVTHWVDNKANQQTDTHDTLTIPSPATLISTIILTADDDGQAGETPNGV